MHKEIFKKQIPDSKRTQGKSDPIQIGGKIIRCGPDQMQTEREKLHCEPHDAQPMNDQLWRRVAVHFEAQFTLSASKNIFFSCDDDDEYGDDAPRDQS